MVCVHIKCTFSRCEHLFLPPNEKRLKHLLYPVIGRVYANSAEWQIYLQLRLC